MIIRLLHMAWNEGNQSDVGVEKALLHQMMSHIRPTTGRASQPLDLQHLPLLSDICYI
jgi:hypothetical protein